MRKLQSLLRVPYKGKPVSNQNIFFAQFLVHTAYDETTFARETANAVLIQAEQKGIDLRYVPNGEAFVTRIDCCERVMEFGGDVAGYLELPDEDARTFHVSFRNANKMDDKAVTGPTHFSPTYVLTFSVVAQNPGELGDAGFLTQFANHLWSGIVEPDMGRGRPGDPHIKIAIIHGNELRYSVVLGQGAEF